MAKGYLRSYTFGDDGKDPAIAKLFEIIDRKKLKVKDLHLASDLNGKKVSASTIYNWRKDVDEGGTRRPQHCTLQAIALACGCEYRLMPAVGAAKAAKAAKPKRVVFTPKRTINAHASA